MTDDRKDRFQIEEDGVYKVTQSMNKKESLSSISVGYALLFAFLR